MIDNTNTETEFELRLQRLINEIWQAVQHFEKGTDLKVVQIQLNEKVPGSSIEDRPTLRPISIEAGLF